MSSSHQVRGWHNGSPRSSGAGYGVVMSEGVRDAGPPELIARLETPAVDA